MKYAPWFITSIRITLTFLVVVSCVHEEPTTTDRSIELYLEAIYRSQVWLRVSTTNSGETKEFEIVREGKQIISGIMTSPDTVVADNTVHFDSTYTYVAYLINKDVAFDSSSAVSVTIDDSTASFFRFLGFKDKSARRLRSYHPYLYACAGPEGLWRKNIQLLQSFWEYMGLSDTTFAAYGVRDVVIRADDPNNILVAFQPASDEDPSNIYRTINDGITWDLADSGLYYEAWGYDTLIPDHPTLFLDYQVIEDKVLAFSSGLYVTKNFGETWENLRSLGPPGGSAWYEDVTYHPKYPNIAWIGGRTGRMEATLAKSVDYGHTWEQINLKQQGVTFGYSIPRIALDREDPGMVYVPGGSGTVNKSEDGGITWTSTLTLPDESLSHTIISDPGKSGHLFIATSSGIAETYNNGETWIHNDLLNEWYVRDIVYDSKTMTLLLDTDIGTYQYYPISN